MQNLFSNCRFTDHDRKRHTHQGLTKRFGSFVAVGDLDLDVDEGTVVSLLGPNGAGKTTTVRMLATLIAPDAGEAQVAGYDVVRDEPTTGLDPRSRQVVWTTIRELVDDGVCGRSPACPSACST